MCPHARDLARGQPKSSWRGCQVSWSSGSGLRPARDTAGCPVGGDAPPASFCAWGVDIVPGTVDALPQHHGSGLPSTRTNKRTERFREVKTLVQGHTGLPGSRVLSTITFPRDLALFPASLVLDMVPSTARAQWRTVLRRSAPLLGLGKPASAGLKVLRKMEPFIPFVPWFITMTTSTANPGHRQEKVHLISGIGFWTQPMSAGILQVPTKEPLTHLNFPHPKAPRGIPATSLGPACRRPHHRSPRSSTPRSLPVLLPRRKTLLEVTSRLLVYLSKSPLPLLSLLPLCQRYTGLQCSLGGNFF